MSSDRRQAWEFMGCVVCPKACHTGSNWGKESEPIDFHDGRGPRTHWWQIVFPNGTWVNVAGRKQARDYIVHCWRGDSRPTLWPNLDHRIAMHLIYRQR